MANRTDATLVVFRNNKPVNQGPGPKNQVAPVRLYCSPDPVTNVFNPRVYVVHSRPQPGSITFDVPLFGQADSAAPNRFSYNFDREEEKALDIDATKFAPNVVGSSVTYEYEIAFNPGGGEPPVGRPGHHPTLPQAARPRVSGDDPAIIIEPRDGPLR